MTGYTIVANWKMNGDLAFFNHYFSNFNPEALSSDTKVIVAPQAPLLAFQDKINVSLAAQNMSEHEAGPYTGEINAALLKSFGVKYVILGHSERRQQFHESNTIVQAKAALAMKHGIIPIICIGESLNAYERGETKKILKVQMAASIPKDAKANTFFIAYEPIWAIGSGKTPTSEEIAAIHAFIKEETTQYGAVSILYGGSVKPNNAKEILTQPYVNGVLVGGASLEPKDFLAIAAATPNSLA